MTINREEFALIFDELYPKLCRFLGCLMGRDAQDIAQEALMRLYCLEEGRLPRAEMRFWVFRVASNLAYNEMKRRQRQEKILIQFARFFQRPVESPEENLMHAERTSLLIEELQLLPEHQRAALLLREQEEMSYQEIATVLGVSESKIKVDIFRARDTLRSSWRKKQTTRSESKIKQQGG